MPQALRSTRAPVGPIDQAAQAPVCQVNPASLDYLVTLVTALRAKKPRNGRGGRPHGAGPGPSTIDEVKLVLREHIRPLDATDWAAVAVLLGRPDSDAALVRDYVERNYSPWVGGVVERGAPDDRDADRGQRRSVIGVVMAGVPRRPSGRSATTAQVVGTSVAPAARRLGHGRRLLQWLVNELRAGGTRQVVADVRGTEVEALALFRAAGFREEGRTFELSLPREAGQRLMSAVAPQRADTEVPPNAMPGRQTPTALWTRSAQQQPASAAETIRPLTFGDVPSLHGLLIRLGMERAESPQDDLPALTPSVLEEWLQRRDTVALASWDAADPDTPLGLAWATRQGSDATLQFIGVAEDYRQQGIGTALLGALLIRLATPRGSRDASANVTALPALRAILHDAPDRPHSMGWPLPSGEAQFFQHAGFVVERATSHFALALADG